MKNEADTLIRDGLAMIAKGIFKLHDKKIKIEIYRTIIVNLVNDMCDEASRTVRYNRDELAKKIDAGEDRSDLDKARNDLSVEGDDDGA